MIIVKVVKLRKQGTFERSRWSGEEGIASATRRMEVSKGGGRNVACVACEEKVGTG